MKNELTPLYDALLAGSEDSREVTLDAIGEALGARAVSTADIEELMDALVLKGRHIVGSATGGRGVANLRAVLAAARTLGAELGRAPTAAEIAARSGLSLDAVRHALALAQVMQR